jgi:hypothetical protein
MEKFKRLKQNWGEINQQKISNYKFLVVNCDFTSIEFIKNLVLTGVQEITIIQKETPKVHLEFLSFLESHYQTKITFEKFGTKEIEKFDVVFVTGRNEEEVVTISFDLKLVSIL